VDESLFLARVRARLSEARPPRPAILAGEPVPGDEIVDLFRAGLTQAAGVFHTCDEAALPGVIEEVLEGLTRPQVLITREEGVPAGTAAAVEGAGGRVLWWPEVTRQQAAQADVGMTSALWAVSETGSVVVSSAAPGGRAPSLLPSRHVAFVARSRLLPALTDLFARIQGMNERPSNLVLVTGPSKTGDIEMELVKGVHGPSEAHVVLIEGA
jgi:L-lactate dehydrogenase complex protein LldG